MLNKAIIAGNLTRDPELKTLPSGIKVANFSIATNRVWSDSSGQRQEAVDYHNIVVFGRQAETSAQYLRKGAMAIVEGRLQTRSWDDQESGKKMYRTEVVADRVQFGPRSAGISNSTPSGTSGQVEHPVSAPSTSTAAPSTVVPSADSIEYPEEDINPEDIPF